MVFTVTRKALIYGGGLFCVSVFQPKLQIKMSSMVHIPEHRVRQLLNWEKTFEAVERAMVSVAKDRAFQNARPITKLPNSENMLFTMPGYLDDDKYRALGCKLVTYFPNNPIRNEPLPSIMANILLMDDQTGELKAVVAGTEITTWRTAAASAVATKHLHCKKPGSRNNILAILGAGTQGKIHAVAFQHFFNFSQVRIWNRTPERAKNLALELNQGKISKETFVAYESAEECVKGADVIVTATTAEIPVIKFDWLKKGVHINAVGVGNNRELDDATYKVSDVFIDYWDGAKSELEGLKEIGVEFKGQIGDVIAGLVPQPAPETLTIFQSLGMAVEDCAMARLIYDLHMQKPT